MAIIRSSFQISGVVKPKCASNYDPLHCLIQPIFRNFFSRSKPENPEEKCCPTGCRRPGTEPECPQLCQGLPSKCLEADEKPAKRKWFFGKKPKVKEKPTNCLPEPPPPVETFWDYIFGPGKEQPDQTICREEYLRRMKCRQYDVRLCDPRYKTTPGGFYLVYTESPNDKPSPKLERQPREPLPYKEPKSVTCKRLAEAVSSANFVRVRRPVVEDDEVIKMYQYEGPEPMRLPYQEMRPTPEQRKIFSCKEGLHSEDVIPAPLHPRSCPITADDFDTKSSGSVDYPEIFFSKDLDDPKDGINPGEECTAPIKLSRIERLQRLVALSSMTPTSPICTDTRAAAPDPNIPYPCCSTPCDEPPPRCC